MLINADLNGAGNILRKAYPTAFEGITDYHFLNKNDCKKMQYHVFQKWIAALMSGLVFAQAVRNHFHFFVRENASGSS